MVEVDTTKLNPSTHVFETKLDSVRESSLSGDMALVRSTCDRDTFAHALCTVFCCAKSDCHSLKKGLIT